MLRRRRPSETIYSTFTVEREGWNGFGLRDVYAGILEMKWRFLYVWFLTIYFGANALFAGLFVLGGDCVEGARPGSFLDAFFFSIQTLSTIGYGQMSPVTTYAETVVAVESFVGIIGVAVATGIIFTKFARPTAGMVFTKKAVVHERNGVPCLVFRIANARGGEIVEAALRATVLMTEITPEGHRMRRLHDLELRRSVNPILLLSWTVIHEIDAASPLYGMTAEDLKEEDIRLIVNITGIDGTFMQNVYRYQLYMAEDIVFDHTFADVVVAQEAKRFRLDMRQFDVLEPVVGPVHPGDPQ